MGERKGFSMVDCTKYGNGVIILPQKMLMAGERRGQETESKIEIGWYAPTSSLNGKLVRD